MIFPKRAATEFDNGLWLSLIQIIDASYPTKVWGIICIFNIIDA